MPSEKLYDKGWRQGTVLTLPLTVSSSVWQADSGTTDTREIRHDTWVVATQDCNLNRAAVNRNTATIELRQVHIDQPPNTWGIHSRKFRLDGEGRYVIDDKAAHFVSPKALVQAAEIITTLPNDRVAAFKMWLGTRYNRPAVPAALVPLARAIAEAIEAEFSTDLAAAVRDVYMTFDEEPEPPRFSLFAVLAADADVEAVRVAMADASFRVSAHLGLLDEVRAAESSGTSLDLLENAYCADLSQLTWDVEEVEDGAST